MGWHEHSDNEEGYAPLTEDEKKEFQKRKSQQLKKNGFTTRILPSTWNSGSLPISSITQVSLDDTFTSSDTDSSDDDEAHSWDQFATLWSNVLWRERVSGHLDNLFNLLRDAAYQRHLFFATVQMASFCMISPVDFGIYSEFHMCSFQHIMWHITDLKCTSCITLDAA